MYEKINFSSELKKLSQAELIRFLGAQLKKDEKLQKEFIKRFNLSVQKKFIQDYIKEFDIALKKSKKSIGNKQFIYDSTKFNTNFLGAKISYLKVLQKQGEYLEALKLCVVVYSYISKIIAHNGIHEAGQSKTTAEKYEKKWMSIQTLLVELYLKIDEDEYHLFDRKTFFNVLKELYDEMLPSYVFNFIFVREHVKLEWFKKVLREEDQSYLE